MTEFSLLVPFAGPVLAFEDTLADILRTRPPNSQVIVVHDGRYSDRYGLSGDVEFVVSSNAQRLIACWNESLSRARGEFVVWFRPGLSMDDGWDLDCLSGFADPNVGVVSPSISVRTGRRFRELTGIGVDRDGTRQPQFGKTQRNLIGPTSYAMAFRHSALQWLEQVDLSWEDEYLDAYLAQAIRELGYFCHYARNWCLQLDFNLVGEAIGVRPHGLSAARSLNRFSTAARFGLPAAATLRDFIRTYREPWRIAHATGRWGAGRFAAQDRALRNKDVELRTRCQRVREKNPQNRAGRRVA